MSAVNADVVAARRPQEAARLFGAEDGVARDALLAHEDGQYVEIDGEQLARLLRDGRGDDLAPPPGGRRWML